eukprot:3067377-Pyramimonas_sp.AAC.1
MHYTADVTAELLSVIQYHAATLAVYWSIIVHLCLLYTRTRFPTLLITFEASKDFLINHVVRAKVAIAIYMRHEIAQPCGMAYA